MPTSCKQRRDAHALDQILTQRERAAELGGVELDAPHVASGGGVLRLDRHGERFDGREVHLGHLADVAPLVVHPSQVDLVETVGQEQRHEQRERAVAPGVHASDRDRRHECARRSSWARPRDTPGPTRAGANGSWTARRRWRRGSELHRKYASAEAATDGTTSPAWLSAPPVQASTRAPSSIESTRDDTLKRVRYHGLRTVTLNVHCAQPPAMVTQAAAPGPSTSSDPKFTANPGESEDTDRPTGSGILMVLARGRQQQQRAQQERMFERPTPGGRNEERAARRHDGRHEDAGRGRLVPERVGPGHGTQGA